MPKSKSSRRWLKEHFDDPYVKKAQQEGYRSRSIYKLIEIDEKYKLLKPGLKLIELGAAPGGWSEYASQKLFKQSKKAQAKNQGMLIAVDILAMEPIDGVTVIQGDFTTDETLAAVMAALDDVNNPSVSGCKVDLVMSDMAPNISGMSSVDQPRAMYLAELAWDLAARVLNEGGNFLVKMFQGEGFDAYVQMLRGRFKQIKFVKPKASRPRSREVYLLAMGHKMA